MKRKFKTADYEKTLDLQISLRDVLPPDHVIPFRFIAGDMHPDHDTIAHFHRQFLTELKELFVQILLIAQAMGRFQLGNVSLDGSKIHADAAKSKAVSYKRLLAIEAYLQAEVNDYYCTPRYLSH